MKKRIFLVLALVVFTSSQCISTPTSRSQTTATPQPTATSTPNNSKKPSTLEQITSLIQEIDNLGTAIVLLVAKLLAVLLISYLLYRLYLLLFYRSSQLVIDNVRNASAQDKLDDNELEDLSQLARENLVREMKSLRHRVKFIISVGIVTLNSFNRSQQPQASSNSSQLPEANSNPLPREFFYKAPLPEEAQEQAGKQLDELVKTVSTFIPKYVAQVMELLKVVFPPKGTTVTSILQNHGEENSNLGISFEIKDIETHRPLKLYTIWESADPLNTLSKKTPKERYVALLKPATYWLAMELSRQEMVTTLPKTYSGSSAHYKAEINNFFGVLNYHSASTYGNFFYDLAIEDLQEAIDHDPSWYQSYENLASVYSTQGQVVRGNKGIDLQYQAIFQCQEALNQLQNEKLKDKLERRIKVGRAMAELLTGDKGLIDTAIQEIKKVEKCWDDASEEDTRLLYNLACWHATAIRQGCGDADAKSKARRYLFYALVRNRLLWNWAGKDPDIKNICESLPQLQIKLSKKLQEEPNLPNLLSWKFADHIEQVMQDVKWL